MADDLIFVTGGARSGKSRFALERALALGGRDVTVVATAEALDDEMRDRIARHRAERPQGWRTLEVSRHLESALESCRSAVVLLDCLSLWVSNLMLDGSSEAEMLERVDALLRVQQARSGALIVVSNEVGSGLVPDSPLGRSYRDVLGRANQMVARASNQTFLTVAGLPLQIK
jgi:adenosyl cobinamide kinase/adenosyl cobinamide phosphate guanylyltransferase